MNVLLSVIPAAPKLPLFELAMLDLQDPVDLSLQFLARRREARLAAREEQAQAVMALEGATQIEE